MEHQHFFTYILALAIAGMALVASFRLKSRYSWPPLSSWFYYLLFFFLMVLANTAMVQLAGEVLPLDPAGRDKLRHLMHTFLAQPCFVVSFYMMLRTALLMLRRNPPRHFNPVYFGFWGLFSAVTLILTFRYFNTGDDLLLRSIYDNSDLAITAAWPAIGLWIIWRARRLNAREGAIAATRFGWIFLVSQIVYTLSLALPLQPAIWLTFRVLYNLPPLAYLLWYVPRHHQPETAESCGVEGAEAVFSRHGITEREQQVVRLLCDGKSNKEISSELFISLQTVKHHVHSVYRKMGVDNRVQLCNRMREDTASGGDRGRDRGRTDAN